MKLKALAMAAMVGLGTLPMALQAAEVPEGPHVVTSGTASVDATPDIATLAIEVSVSSKDAAQAKKQVDERVAQYFDFLQKNNIEKKDISAANLRTQPEYDYLKTGESVLKGYRAVRQVQVTLRQLDKLNELLDGALKSGLNEIRAVELGVAKPDVYREQARQKRSRTRLSRPNPWPKASTPSWGRCTAFATGLPTTSRCRWRGCIRRPVRRRKATRRKPMNSKAFTSTIRWMWCSSCSATPCSKVFVLKKRFAAANLFRFNPDAAPGGRVPAARRSLCASCGFPARSGASTACGAGTAPASDRSVHRMPAPFDLQVRIIQQVVPWRASCTKASDEFTMWQGTLPGDRSKFCCRNAWCMSSR